MQPRVDNRVLTRISEFSKIFFDFFASKLSMSLGLTAEL